MSDKLSNDTIAEGFNESFRRVSAYFEGLISCEASPLDFAARLNAEVPSRMSDTRRTLVAMMEERLAERADKAVSRLDARARIRYYDEKIESRLASGCRLPEWTPWRPALTQRARQTGVVIAGIFELATVLAIIKAARVPLLKFPLLAGSPHLTAVILGFLALLSAVAAKYPEKIPNLLDRERKNAQEHLTAYLQNAEASFLNFMSGAEASMDAYLDQIRGGNA